MTEHSRIVDPRGPVRHRFTRNDYLLLDRAETFRKHAKTELVEGTIYAMNAQFSRHARVHGLLYQASVAACALSQAGLSAWIEVSLALAEDSMPQPDIVIVRELPDEGAVPAASVVLVIEVADTSLAFDLDAKQRIYAAAAIPEYWVVDVNGRMIRQMWSPDDTAYTQVRENAFGGDIAAVTSDSLVIATDRL